MDSTALPRPTIRHVDCSLLLAESSDSDRCERCTTYRKTLVKATSRKADTEAPAHSHTNHRYLNSPQKVARIKELQHNNRVSRKRIDRLSKRIEELTARSGVCLDDDMNGDLKEIMKQEDKGQCFIESMVKWGHPPISLPLSQSHLRLHSIYHCHCKNKFYPSLLISG